MSKIKKGDIVVRDKASRHTDSPIGKMVKVVYAADHTSVFHLAGGWRILKKNCRLATPEEAEAYKNGIKNINKMPKIKKLYEIW